MNTQGTAAVLLIVSALVILGASFVNAPGLYQTEDIEERMEIIEANRARWLANQALVLVWAVTLVAGSILLASVLRSATTAWIPTGGAAAIALGSLAGMYFLYRQTVDPRGAYSGAYPLPEDLTYWLLLAGMLLFGIAFLQSDLPNWLGYLTAGAAGAYGLVFLLSGAGFMTPFLLALVGMVVGVVLLRQ